MTNFEFLPKAIIILGPTASGKTAWAVELSKEFKGEVISADSRQVYTKMNIGTAKPKGEWRGQGEKRAYYVDSIPHYLMDFLDPSQVFTVAEWRDAAIRHINEIVARGRVPFIVGGTGLYMSALAHNWVIPRVAPNKKLRESLEKKSLDDLVNLFAELDPQGIKVIDRKNKRRLIRALEVSILSGVPFSRQRVMGEKLIEPLILGIDVPRDVLYNRIDTRVEAMIEQGLLNEIRRLREKYAWELPSMSSLGYRQLKGYLDGATTLEQAVAELKRDTRHLARRQMTWWRPDKQIQWCQTSAEAKINITQFFYV